MKKLSLLMLLSSTLSYSAIAEPVNQDTLAQTGALNTSKTPLFGAEVYSNDKVLYGKFVTRMKLVSSPGVVSSFFTYDNESWQGKGKPWSEIDFEAIGKTPNQLQTNLITGQLNSRKHSEKKHQVPQLEDFVEYTITWTPDEIIWQVDGKTVRHDTADNSKQVVAMRDIPQSYRMNIWISEAVGWVGRFKADSLPLHQVVDWMEFYEYQENGEFSLAWRDDFTSFDEKRWGKGDWGFESNLVTFSPKNANIVDGKLVLSLSEEGMKLNYSE
ncbi:family 16 glycosylhydrolase [Agarivorans sp. Alg241-V36]|uniref:family 16 glycosylhydrolase n=1 Tax=Agarivorans sp. Alg241-V36 TaxID=2305992 RepID=UPI0013D6C997|nr:family 16 glycosylhydrolase [Agarivorans sp. Alg241-V36]